MVVSRPEPPVRSDGDPASATTKRSSATGKSRLTICVVENSPFLAGSTRSSFPTKWLRRCATCVRTPTANDWFRIRVDGDRVILSATDDERDELIGFVAAEAHHEPDPRRQRRLDVAFEVLSDAAQTQNGG
jgi:hypothetical protein